jgi:glycolate oxidase FAD binding subunit
MKNVAGYDISRLLAGSMGVLGVILEVSLKVLPLQPATATLRFELDEAAALQQLHAWGGQPLPLNASCWMAQGGQGWLYLRLRGAQAAVEAACRQLGGERADVAESAASWTALRDQAVPFFAELAGSGQDLWRVSVPQTAPVLSIAGAQAPLVEWHGGQRWYALPPGQAAGVRAAARTAGGHATLFRRAAAGGEGANTGGVDTFDSLSPALHKIHAALKREFDPHGIFNRGRLYADL